MEGDDELLADMDVKVAPKRDEWMTTLLPERKFGMTMQSTTFSKSSKAGRSDTSVWTDTPSERAQKAKMNYLEAYTRLQHLLQMKWKRNVKVQMQIWWMNTIKKSDQNLWYRSTRKRLQAVRRKKPNCSQRKNSG